MTERDRFIIAYALEFLLVNLDSSMLEELAPVVDATKTGEAALRGLAAEIGQLQDEVATA